LKIPTIALGLGTGNLGKTQAANAGVTLFDALMEAPLMAEREADQAGREDDPEPTS